MKQPSKPPRDDVVLIASLAAAVAVNVLLLWGFQGSIDRPIVARLTPVPGGDLPAKAVPAPKVETPPEAPKRPEEKPPEKPKEKPKEKPPEAKKPEPKPPPKRVVVERKAEPATPPSKAKPGDADLAPLRVEAPEPMSVDMAQLVRIEVENRGTAVAGPHRDALYFSQDGNLDAKAVPVGTIEAGGPLAPGAKAWERVQVLLPDQTPSGRGYLIVVLNADGAMPETNHANNKLVVPVMVDASGVPLGDPNERPRTTVAWISSKDFRELKARQSRTLQPAVQNEAQVQKDAKLHNQPGAADPDPVIGQVKPKPAEPVAAQPVEKPPKLAPTEQRKDGGAEAPSVAKPPVKPPAGDVAKTKEEAQPKPPAKAAPEKGAAAKPETKVASAAPGQGKPLPPKPAEKPKAADGAKPEGESTPTVVAGKEPKPSEPVAKTGPAGVQDAGPKPKESAKPVAASTGEGATSTPLDTSSAPATQLDETSLDQQPGRVLVGRGVKINTARIQPPSPASLIAGVSANPRVAVTFNAAGEVIKAEIIRSSGNIGWDHQVQLAMQRWTAEGEEVKRGGLVVRWTILLGAGEE